MPDKPQSSRWVSVLLIVCLLVPLLFLLLSPGDNFQLGKYGQMADEQMMDGMMSGMMQFCMIAGTLLVLIVLITMIIQAVLQAKILKELRHWRAERTTPQSSESATGA